MGSVSDSAEPAAMATAGRSERPGGGAYLRLLPVQPPAPRLARAILVVVFGGIYTVAFIRILTTSRGVEHVVLSGVYMLGLLGLQLFYLSRPTSRPTAPGVYAALLAQALLVYLPLLQFKQAWVGLPGFLAGSVLLVLPPVLGWGACTLVVASMSATQWILTHRWFDTSYTVVSTIITAFVVYGLSRLAGLVVQLHSARGELARMAVADERLRFARDLHDLLGYSLAAITLKSELTHRLVLTQPAKAQEELSDVLDIARRALADVRSVASGYRELSLEAEAGSARSVLIDAEVDVQMQMDYGELPAPVRTVLATVLREGVTNVLRHSKAEHCEITILQDAGQVRMDLVNDGVAQTPARDAVGGGSGIPNLSVRAAALGGKLTAGLDPDGRFRLHVAVPASLPRGSLRAGDAPW
jgi:two-component system sensor histidine kinase DesK